MKISTTTRSTADNMTELLEWDTEFWGLRVGRAVGFPDNSLSQWAVDHTVGLMCLLIDTDRPEEAQRAEDQGYRFMDVRATLARQTAPYASRARMHRAEDVATLRQIARVSHRITRFYADPRLKKEDCDRLYDEWIRRSCAGWADLVLVSEREGEAAGYITVHLGGEDTASIGLIAVTEQARRQGIGKELVLGAIDFAHSRDRQHVTVVTQGRNIEALRLFQACGFQTTATELWYHRWYDEPPPPPVRKAPGIEMKGV